MSVGAVSGAGGSLLEQAQRIVADGPEQVRAFEATLDEAGRAGEATPGGLAVDVPGTPDAAVGVSSTDARPQQTLERVDQPGGTEKMLRDVERGHQRLSELVGELGSGRTFSPQELLGLQSEMHHIMRQLETTGKMLGEVVSGAKTLLQQQV